MNNRFKFQEVTDKTEWNELFRRCRETGLMQLWEYGESVYKCIGWKPLRHAVIKDDRVLAIAQTLIKDIPALGKVARIQHGPMFPDENADFSADTAIEAICALRDYFVLSEGMILHLTPCLTASDLLPGWHLKNGFETTGEALWASVKMDLTQNQESLLANMKRKWRNPLKKILNSGLEIDVANSGEAVSFFLEKYARTTLEKGISWPSADLVDEFWQARKTASQIFFCLKDSKRIAAMIVTEYAGVGFCFVAWNGPESKTYHAHNFVIWHAVLNLQKRGFQWLDLGGIDPENLPGITKFKRNTGGVEYSLAGNYRDVPETSPPELAGSDYQGKLGHVLPGLQLPRCESLEKADIEARVGIIINEFIRKMMNADFEVDGEVSLIDGGIIDSLSLVSVIQALQDAFDIKISPHEITIGNFDNLHNISSFISSKLAE